MTEAKKRRVLMIGRVNGDGTPVAGAITLVLKDPATNEELRAPDGSPEVFLELRAIDEDQRKSIIAAHTRLEKDPAGGRGLYEFTDAKAANDDLLDHAIVRWTGLAGANGLPLVCTRQTKLLLDVGIRAQVMKKVFGAEVTEVLADSFR